MDFENFKDAKKVKIIIRETAEEVEREAKEFEKTHTVIGIKQKNDKQMFIFYI